MYSIKIEVTNFLMDLDTYENKKEIQLLFASWNRILEYQVNRIFNIPLRNFKSEMEIGT